MKHIIFLFFFLIISFDSFSQSVYSTDYNYQAEINVFVTKYKYSADLLVFKVKEKYQAKENSGLWYFSNITQSDKKIFFVKYDYQADLKIFFVDYKYQAGWVKNKYKYLLY